MFFYKAFTCTCTCRDTSEVVEMGLLCSKSVLLTILLFYLVGGITQTRERFSEKTNSCVYK